MSIIFEERFASHPSDAKKYDTTQLRQHFLIEKVILYVDGGILATLGKAENEEY